MELELARSVVALELAGVAPAIAVSSTPVTVDLSAPHLAITLELEWPVLEVAAAPVLEILAPALTLEIAVEGTQGPPGPQQIFAQDAQPSGTPTYPLIWFDTDAHAPSFPTVAAMKVWRP
jgi:hypothetical protein